MRMTAGGLLAALAFLVTPVLAQRANPVAAGDCAAQKASIEQDMATARSKGQMLQRRQLAETLAQLQERCSATAPAVGGAAEIERLEKEVRALQEELEHAQTRLRALKSKAP